MPCGTSVALLDGPSSTPAAGWWNVRFGALTGWASAEPPRGRRRLHARDSLRRVRDGGSGSGGADEIPSARAPSSPSATPTGHGSWRDDGATVGSCAADCAPRARTAASTAPTARVSSPRCGRSRRSARSRSTPTRSTANFYTTRSIGRQIPRSTIAAADALVRPRLRGVHRALRDRHRPFLRAPSGSHEACGGATGVVHDLRTVDSSLHRHP